MTLEGSNDYNSSSFLVVPPKRNDAFSVLKTCSISEKRPCNKENKLSPVNGFLIMYEMILIHFIPNSIFGKTA